jgi:signal peptidase I
MTVQESRAAGYRPAHRGPSAIVRVGPAASRAALRRGLPFLAAAAVAAALALVGVLSAVALGARVLGWEATTVASGSMAPGFRKGDVVLLAPVTGRGVGVGQVARFADPNRPDRHVLHRVVGIDGGLLRTRGDANPSPDSAPVALTAVDGVARFRLPALGLPAQWTREHPGAGLGVATVLVAAAGVLAAQRRRRRIALPSRTTIGVAGVAGLCLTLAVAWQGSAASFTATTENSPDAWAAGVVTLSDDDGGSTPATGTALFGATGLALGGPAASWCVTVTYTGSAPAPVKLYATNLAGTGLGTYLNLTVEIGSGGGYASCAGFTPGATLFNGTLAGYVGAHGGYPSGLAASWTPTTFGDAKVFRVTYSLQNDPAAVALTASANLVWEAQG